MVHTLAGAAGAWFIQTGQLADTPTRVLPTRKLVNSSRIDWTSSGKDMDIKSST